MDTKFIPTEFINSLLSRVQILDVVKDYLKVEKSSSQYKAVCPFHNEKTPSFFITPDKNVFHCFGCGESGNAISFMMKIENLTFPDAVVRLAEKFQIPMEFSETYQKKYSKKRDNITLTTLARDYFFENIKRDRSKRIQNYLSARGFSLDIIDMFQLGLAIDSWNGLRDYLRTKKISDNEAENLGLIIKSDKEGQDHYYDRFRNRIMFPICNDMGDVVGFSGRVLDDSIPKYLNSTDSDVYKKGSLLYGLHLAKKHIAKENACILCEGNFDYIRLYSNGILNVVATCGTALTEDHIRLIKRYTNTIICFFDDDTAGRNATLRAIHLFLKFSVNGKIVSGLNGLDPDAFLKTYGVDEIKQKLIAAERMIPYYVRVKMGANTSPSVQDKVKIKNELMTSIKSLTDPTEIDLYTKEIAKSVGIDANILKRENQPKEIRETKTQLKSVGYEKIPYEEKIICKILLHHQNYVEKFIKLSILHYFSSAQIRGILETYIHLCGEVTDFNVSMMFNSISTDDQITHRILADLLQNEHEVTSDNMDAVFSESVNKILSRQIEQKRQEVNRKIKDAEQAGNADEMQALLVEKKKLMDRA